MYMKCAISYELKKLNVWFNVNKLSLNVTKNILWFLDSISMQET